jgi:hypothetical protein
MRMISDLREIGFWTSLSGNDARAPFEVIARSRYSRLVAGSYSILFDARLLGACCAWSKRCDEEVGAFFAEENPQSFFDEAGYYCGLVFDGNDDPVAVGRKLVEDRNGSPVLSVYEASQRMFVMPQGAEWMFIGDRDADLALLCFGSESRRLEFFSDSEAPTTFESLADGVRHARSFMNYTWAWGLTTDAEP